MYIKGYNDSTFESQRTTRPAKDGDIPRDVLARVLIVTNGYGFAKR